MTGGEEFERLLADLRADDSVAGVVLGGSRGKGALVRPDSDYDVYVVVDRDDAVEPCRLRYGRPRGEPIEVFVLSLAGFRAHAAVGSETESNRYTFAHVRPLVDKSGGEVSRLVEEKGRLPRAAARERVASSLDAYVNSYYRSAKNLVLGLELEARLDAGESIPFLLTALFALDERVRPYNKWLAWELRQHPLDGGRWRPDELPPRLDRIATTGDLREQQLLFRAVEQRARERGFASVIDGWEPDVAWLRGE